MSEQGARRHVRAPADDLRDLHEAADLDLQHAAEGVRDVLGYGVVAVSLLRGTGEYEFVAVVGPPDARDYLLGTHLAGEQLDRAIAAADVHGRVHYVPRGRLPDNGPRWASDAPGTTDPELWSPDDELFVMFVDQTGSVRGHVAVDHPPQGRVPTVAMRRQLEAYVERMVPVLLHADSLHRSDEQLRIAAQARRVVRSAITRLDESDLLDAAGADLADCLRADEVWFHTEEPRRLLRYPAEAGTDPPPGIVELLRVMADRAWRDQQAVVVEHERVLPEGPGSDGWEEVLGFLHGVGLESMLLVPVGAGVQCLGAVVGVRHAGAAEWSDLEILAAQDLGRDLGSALQTARFFERERGHAAYKQQLIATIAHELKNPLTAVRGNLELLQDELAEHPAATMLSDRIGRATHRLAVLVDNLLTLSAVDEAADVRDGRSVDLAALVADAVEVVTLQAGQRGVAVSVDAVPGARVRGMPGELEHLVVNLVSNAVKYSDDGGEVTIRVATDDRDAVLAVTDRGIGIAEEERSRIFGEFFRSANPRARTRPGTGLGLAIAARVVERHGGRIEVESTLGQGSTFEVRLPLDR